MSIIKGLFLGLRNQKVIPFNQMTPELHDQISSSLAKLMMVAKMTKAKLTKAQQNYIMNQAKQVQEFEDRYITKIKDSAGNLIKKDEKVADVFDLKGRTLDPNKIITGGTQEGAELQSGIMKATGAKPKKVKETEAQILARMNRENKEAAERIRNKKKLEDSEDMAQGLSDKDFRSEKTSFRLNIGKNTPEFNQDLADRIIKREIYTDLSDSQRKQFLDDLDFVLKNPRDGNAQGGRIGLKDGPDMPGRRKFMKIMGGIASLPFIGKYLKPAMPLIKKGAEITGPALDKIVETVMSAGKLISQSGKRLKELTTKKKLKDVEVEEDIMDGPSYTIKTRDKTIYYKPGRQDEMGIEDDIIEVLEDTVTKKAGGGIARMLGE